MDFTGLGRRIWKEGKIGLAERLVGRKRIISIGIMENGFFELVGIYFLTQMFMSKTILNSII